MIAFFNTLHYLLSHNMKHGTILLHYSCTYHHCYNGKLKIYERNRIISNIISRIYSIYNNIFASYEIRRVLQPPFPKIFLDPSIFNNDYYPVKFRG